MSTRGLKHIEKPSDSDDPLQVLREEKPRVLVVDDSPDVVQMLRTLLHRAGYDCVTAYSAAEAHSRLEAGAFALVLSDVHMPPGDSGLQLIEEILKRYPTTATMLVTAVDDPKLGALALRHGAYGYVLKPFNDTELLINVANALLRRRLTLENRAHREKLEEAVMARTRELLDTIYRLENAERELLASHMETIDRLCKAAEFRDNETAQHIQRMSRYCEMLGRVIGLEKAHTDLIRKASPMHDIGKVGIDDAVLLKPGKFTADEYEVMKRHAEIGYRILSGSRSELLDMGANTALTHHERYDGSGYPRGLAGEEIPLEGRIAAIADVFDALTCRRIYKPAISVAEARALMTARRGSHFDPGLLDRFWEALPEIMRIRAQFPEA